MPIQGAATKLKLEMEKYGVPPVVPTVKEEAPPPQKQDATAKLGQFKSKKTKTVRKTGAAKLQWDILKMSGIPEEEIPRFADPVYWLNYFPALGEQDLKKFGLHTDWRRSFITTSENKFYDKFIRWQFLRLKDGAKIDFGKRPTIFSPLDKQACADHDRSTGEGVAPQEYTAIKLRLLELGEDALEQNPLLRGPLEAGDVYLVAATLRPETMYGQTNCFVLPSGTYGAYEFDIEKSKGGERVKQVLVCSARAARNMSHQDPFTAIGAQGKLKKLATLTGKQLLGLPLRAPKTSYERVYTLPLLTISMTKGTGIVTSVPSDAPDDYAALRDLQTDEKLRAKHGISEDMVVPFKVIPVVDIPGIGINAAVHMCDKLKIKSQNDTKKLAQAKEEVYKKGFYEGTMVVGADDGIHGMKVCDAKDIIKAKMVSDQEAIIYYEPENEVVSRSGDECVVSYLDQWFLKYGEDEWRAQVLNHVTNVDKFETFTAATRKAFVEVVNWLNEWACSRSFGLGTLLPWDEQFVIESLSDSTVYMAYYTISHLLQGRQSDTDYTGNHGNGSPLGIKPEDMTPEVFDYIFLKKGYPSGCSITEDKLQKMRDSFEYWYPMNLRVSGRDLIRNHLTMCLYNHAAIWHERPEMMPQGFFANGFIEVEGKKMSKSDGNFIMLHEATSGHREFDLDGKKIVVGWTTDATRMALANAGDGLDDANFSVDIANQTILKLNIEVEFAKEWCSSEAQRLLRSEEKESYNFFDRAFDAQMDLAVAKTEAYYEAMRFRDVCVSAFYDFTAFRDTYRDACVKENIPMNAHLIRKFLEILCVMVSPIVTHFSEYIWCDILKKQGTVMDAPWPVVGVPDTAFVRSVEFVNSLPRAVRLKLLKEEQRLQKAAKKAKKDPKSVSVDHLKVTVNLARQFPEEHQKVVNFVKAEFEAANKTFPSDLLKKVKTFVVADSTLKPQMKNLMQAAAGVVTEYEENGDMAFELSVPYDQEAMIRDRYDYLKSAMNVDEFHIVVSDICPKGAIPGKPLISVDE